MAVVAVRLEEFKTLCVFVLFWLLFPLSGKFNSLLPSVYPSGRKLLISFLRK